MNEGDVRARKKVLANIHDAIVVKQRLSADLKHEIEWRMEERTKNPYWRLGAKQVQRWHVSEKKGKAQETAHRRRIAEEETVAAGIKAGATMESQSASDAARTSAVSAADCSERACAGACVIEGGRFGEG